MLATRSPLVLTVCLFLAAAPLPAQEWYEAYHSGLAALARGDAAGAVEALRRAIALHPEPGRNVVTYGTNVEPRYFPYLRLAEAYLALGQLEAAQEALSASTSWQREPADERQRLLVRLEAAAEQRRPRAPAPVPTPTPAPTTAASTPAPPVTVAPETPAPPSASVPTPSAPSRAASVPPSVEPRRREGPLPATQAPASHGPETTAGTLEIGSQPPGATVYVDDEAVGSTDPESGRLVKTGLPAGRHRVRVARAGHEDVVRDIDVPAGSRATFNASLRPLPDTPLGVNIGPLALAVVAMVLVVVLVWIALHRLPASPPPIWVPTPLPRTTAGGPATPGQVSPGARRDELGQDWFGEFRLLEMLGRGGMASVFKAERRSELSALKRPLRSFLDDPQFLERFLREAEIGRTLNHPNIVRILERGEVEGVPYFTMELVPGYTLDALVRGQGAVEPRRAAEVVAQVAEALDFAHTKGVVHRDLKPSNIMLLPDGTAKVMDFGIARARRFEGLTATGAFLGTPEYVAPEMIEGGGTEPRSDLYALGVIFFELLTGERPFTGETPFAILKKHATQDAAPPSRIRRAVPPELDAIVLRLLRKDPSERPASAEELVVALRDWLNRAA